MSDPFDYSRYTVAELRDALSHINREMYPERTAELEEWLARRSAEPDALKRPNPSSVDTGHRASLLSVVLSVCGAAAFIAVLTVAALAAVAVAQKQRYDRPSQAFAVAVIRSVARDWSPAVLDQSASKGLNASVSEQSLQGLFEIYRKLGALRRLDAPQGGARVTFGVGTLPSSVTASYVFPAEFDAGRATIQIDLIREEGSWKVAGFFIRSDALFAKPLSEHPDRRSYTVDHS